MTRADYDYRIKENTIFIIDLDQGNMSVTNDIENVIEDIREKENITSNMKVIYRDSDGRWDGFDYKKNNFEALNLTSEQSNILNQLFN